jgi:DNA-binding response OmpR family regulator
MTLQAKGYGTHLALTGEAGQRCLESEAIDLILLDLDLPDIAGVRLCQMIRQKYTLPIVIFSAEGQIDAKVEALEAGANDYIVKPIDIRELLARVQAQLKAISRQTPSAIKPQGNLSYCQAKNQFQTPTGMIYLTENEHQLLLALFQKQGEVMTKSELYAQINSSSYDSERDAHLVEVKISRLRKQLKKFGSSCQILPAYGKGYYLSAEPGSARSM